MAGLATASFMQQVPDEPSTWQFCQPLARDVVYDLIPVAQRREWHARLARAMERYEPRSDSDAEGEYGGSEAVARHLPPATIAFHWSQACEGVEASQWRRSLRAIEWWERSVLAAIDAAAHAEALLLLDRAQQLAELLSRYFSGHKLPAAATGGSSEGSALASPVGDNGSEGLEDWATAGPDSQVGTGPGRSRVG